ncbi:ankyrin repeat-containing domain protein [Mycena vitilis]|nr:ankyrin repeat-containing domain protein [Mycena vitilis]
MASRRPSLYSVGGGQEVGSGRILWCRGIPGAGKTVLASMIVEHLGARSETRNIGVACLYLKHKETDIQSPLDLLCSLWRQLVLGKPITALVGTFYLQHFEKKTKPSLLQIQEAVRSAISQWTKVYIVVDAVDEYPEYPRNVLMDSLVTFGPTVNLMFTSRPHIDLNLMVPSVEMLEIRANADDIRSYVDEQIRRSSRLLKHLNTRPELRQEIHSKILSSVDGMFLLAKLHMESLSTKSTIKAAREALNSLPRDLEHSYDAAMARIADQNEDDIKMAHSALLWIANAKKLLTIPQLQEALAIEPGSKRLDYDNLVDIQTILAACAGLIIIDENLYVTRLVHYTAQHYLDSVEGSRFPDAQITITRSLLTCTFLAFEDFVDSSHRAQTYKPALLEYGQYCLSHARGQPEEHCTDMIIGFLERASQWKIISGWRWTAPPWNFPCWPPCASPIWVAAAANLLGISRYLLDRGTSLTDERSEGYTTPLAVAAYYGHLQMVQLMINHGAEVNAEGGRYGTALQAASCVGQVDAVGLLIASGANINLPGGEYGAALHAASYEGHRNIVELLIRHGANVNLEGGELGTALQGASCSGHTDIVRLLIANGSAINARSGEYGGALRAASYEGQEDVVRLLLESGADLKIQGGRFGTALQVAASSGHTTIARLLIEAGADVNLVGGTSESALQAAAGSGQDSLVQLLIDHGADINARTGKCCTALQAASYGGYEDIVQLLILNGADLNIQGGEFCTPLYAAAQEGHEQIVRILCGNGADVNIQGGNFGSALEAAMDGEYDIIVEILADAGAMRRDPVIHSKARSKPVDSPG